MQTSKNTLATLLIMVIIAIGVIWVINPNTFFQDFHLLIDDMIFSFLNTVVLGFGLGFIESKIKISWVKSPGKRFITTILFYMIFVFIMSNLIFIVEYVIIMQKEPLPSHPMIYFRIAQIPLIVAFVLGGFFTSKSFLCNWRKYAVELERLEKEKVKAQFDALKNQVNPHFLFNSLNALSSLVYVDQSQAVKFIRKLSNVYRYVLDVKDEEVVSLDQELAFVESYIFLQKIRFGENIFIAVNLNGQTHSKYVPPLALQMLIENAFKHNEISAEHPLYISIVEEQGYLEVKNNLNPKLAVETSGVGLQNLQLRYHNLTDKPILLNKADNEYSVKIPVLLQWEA